MDFIYFHLTPALSPRERENCPSAPCHTRDGVCRVSVRERRAGRRLSPAHEPEFQMRLFLSLPVRHERGESRREGLSKRKFLLSPTLSSLLRREEREKRPDVLWFRGPRGAQSPGRSLPEGDGQGEEKRRFTTNPCRKPSNSSVFGLRPCSKELTEAIQSQLD